MSPVLDNFLFCNLLQGLEDLQRSLTAQPKSEKSRWDSSVAVQEPFCIICSKSIMCLCSSLDALRGSLSPKWWWMNAANIFRPPILPPSWATCADLQMLLLDLRFLGDFVAFPLSEKGTNSIPTTYMYYLFIIYIVLYIVICQTWKASPTASFTYALSLPSFMKVMGTEEARSSWKAPRCWENGTSILTSRWGLALVNLEGMRRMTPRLAHPFLISKCSIVNIEWRFLLALFFSI